MSPASLLLFYPGPELTSQNVASVIQLLPCRTEPTPQDSAQKPLTNNILIYKLKIRLFDVAHNINTCIVVPRFCTKTLRDRNAIIVISSGVAPIGPGRALARPLIRQVGPGQARFGCFHDCCLSENNYFDQLNFYI